MNENAMNGIHPTGWSLWDCLVATAILAAAVVSLWQLTQRTNRASDIHHEQSIASQILATFQVLPLDCLAKIEERHFDHYGLPTVHDGKYHIKIDRFSDEYFESFTLNLNYQNSAGQNRQLSATRLGRVEP